MQSIKIVKKGGAEYTKKKKQKTTFFWLEQKADAERILIPHQLEKTHTGPSPVFFCPAHVRKGWENALSTDLWVTNKFQRADDADNAENPRHLSLILFSLCF